VKHVDGSRFCERRLRDAAGTREGPMPGPAVDSHRGGIQLVDEQVEVSRTCARQVGPAIKELDVPHDRWVAGARTVRLVASVRRWIGGRMRAQSANLTPFRVCG
jgi:hypothetical protein